MSYKIFIVDNDNGNVVVDEKEARAIVGAVCYGDKTHTLGLTDCNSFDLACTIHNAKDVIDKLTKENPNVAILLELLKMGEK